MDLVGSTYVKPAASNSAFPALLPATGVGNANFNAFDGGLGATITSTLDIDAARKDKVTVLGDNVMKLGVTVVQGTGMVKGSFMDAFGTLPAPRKTSIRGVVFQRQNKASGFFTGPSASGSIELIPAAAP